MMGAFRPRWTIAASVVVLLSLVASTGCASQNKFTYVVDEPAKTYFKVPSAWTEINPGPIDEYFLENTFGVTSMDSGFASQFFQVKWSAAYDASSDEPGPQRFLSTAQTDEPMAYSLVTPVTEGYRNAVNFDALRNVFIPVTDELRQAIVANGGPAYNVEVLADEILTPESLHGIRTVFNFLVPGSGNSITFDLTALLNQDGSMLHVLVLRCSARCYRARSVELDNIATSFTVGSKV